MNSHFGDSRAWHPACSPTGVLLHRKAALAAVRELFWGILGRGDGGLSGIRVSGSGYNKVLALGVLKCG